MKKDHVLVPEPSSKFNKVKCHECESEQIVYSHSSTQVICNSCGKVLEYCDPRIQNIKQTVEDIFNFKVTSHALNFYGTCIDENNCSNK